MGFVESSLVLERLVLGSGHLSTTSIDELSCDPSSESIPCPQSLLSRRRVKVVNNVVCVIRDDDDYVRKALCVPSTNPVLSDAVEYSSCIESHGNDNRSSDLYWNQKDLLICRKRAQIIANIIRGKFPLEVESLEHVIQNCQVATTIADGKSHHESDSRAILVDNAASRLRFLSFETDDVVAMYNWSSSFVRGLEDFVTPILSSERHRAIHQFLSYQEFLLTEGDPGMSVEDALCERSRTLSQNARVFACKMAIGDALAATHHDF